MQMSTYDDFTDEQTCAAKARKIFLEQLLYIVRRDKPSTPEEELTAYCKISRLGMNLRNWTNGGPDTP